MHKRNSADERNPSDRNIRILNTLPKLLERKMEKMLSDVWVPTGTGIIPTIQ